MGNIGNRKDHKINRNKSKVTWITKMDTFTPSRRFKKNLRYR